MKTISFTRSGKPISDFALNTDLDAFLRSEDEDWQISSHLIIDEVRARIKEGKIKIEDVQIYVEDLDGFINWFPIDKNGRSDGWVDSLEIFENIMLRLL